MGKDASAEDAAAYQLDEAKQTVSSRDGRARYTVFDKAAVRISVEETAGSAPAACFGPGTANRPSCHRANELMMLQRVDSL